MAPGRLQRKPFGELGLGRAAAAWSRGAKGSEWIGPRALAPNRIRIQFGFAFRLLGKLCRKRRGLRWRAPTRRLAAVAPRLRSIEGVDAKLVHPLHFVDPGGVHIIGMVVGR